MKIRAVVFSKNRACQLQLLLTSIGKYASEVFRLSIIYRTTDEAFESSYEKLKASAPPELEIEWIREIDFRSDVLDSLADSKYACFLTDDDIFYRSVCGSLVRQLDDETVYCFSLRLGRNVRRCYPCDLSSKLRGAIEVDEDCIKWNWTENEPDLAYPLSLDGHVFRASDIRGLSESVSFLDPNSYEAVLQKVTLPEKPFMVSYHYSALVNSPNNKVQNRFRNRHAERHAYPAKVLNERYLADEVIDMESLDFSDITACHQELDLPFRAAETA